MTDLEKRILVSLAELPLRQEGTIVTMPDYGDECRRLREVGGIQEGVTVVERLTDQFPYKGGPIKIKVGQAHIVVCYTLAKDVVVEYQK